MIRESEIETFIMKNHPIRIRQLLEKFRLNEIDRTELDIFLRKLQVEKGLVIKEPNDGGERNQYIDLETILFFI